MKITVEERKTAQDLEVTIICARADRRVFDMITRLHMLDRKVTGTADGCTRVLNAEDVLFIDSVDKRTFIYTADTVLETSLRLYEMEERLADCDFLRIAKGCIVNFRAITALKPDVNGRIIATLENGEQVVISRQYASDVKSKLGLKLSKWRKGDWND